MLENLLITPGLWQHGKHQTFYWVPGVMTCATNGRETERSVEYYAANGKGDKYYRDINEFIDDDRFSLVSPCPVPPYGQKPLPLQAPPAELPLPPHLIIGLCTTVVQGKTFSQCAIANNSPNVEHLLGAALVLQLNPPPQDEQRCNLCHHESDIYWLIPHEARLQPFQYRTYVWSSHASFMDIKVLGLTMGEPEPCQTQLND